MNENIKESSTCCFFGHREINETKELKLRLQEIIEKLINENNVETFLFGSKSCFDDVCLKMVTELKEKYPHIKRVYVRAEYPYINDDYKNYLFKYYEDTYYPKKIIGAGRSVYVERNCEMINRSRFCVVYYNKNSAPTTRKSGTEIALKFAVKKGKKIINLT